MKREITRKITKGKVLLLGVGVGLALMAVAACGSGEPKTGGNTGGITGDGNQSAGATALANLLSSPGGAAAYQELLQSSLNKRASSVSGIWVNGHGEATAAPDQGILSLGVESFAQTVAEARGEGAAAMGQVIDVLKGRGIADSDIQTTGFSINARYTNLEVTRCFANGTSVEPEPRTLPQGIPIPPDGESSGEDAGGVEVLESRLGAPEGGEQCVTERERVILGFEVNNRLRVKVRDLAAIGDVIDEATAAGGNLIRFQGVSFAIEDTEALQDEARASAVADLLDKAQQIANLSGVELGDLVYITESGGPVVISQARAESAVFAAASVPTPIQAGELEVNVTVQGAFAILQAE